MSNDNLKLCGSNNNFKKILYIYIYLYFVSEQTVKMVHIYRKEPLVFSHTSLF